LPGSGPYDAAKWGVVGLSKSIAVELARERIRVNCISPGLLNTQIWQDIRAAAPDPALCIEFWNANIPIARVIEPTEIGELAAFLLSDRSQCITGANVFADGGMTSQLISREPYASKGLTPASDR
jgi:NAD(P)-dependent dehydrogenase (short-subunit alcohol dehydrogenase family)